MKHKIIIVTIFLVLILSVLACGTSTSTTPTSQPPVVNTPAVVNTPTVVDTPVTPASDLVITSSNAFVDSYGTYRVVGEVGNNSSKVLGSIELTIEIKDATGNSLLKDNDGNTTPSEIFYPMLYTLAPGEYSPFEYTYDTDDGTPASYVVTITGQATGDADRITLDSANVQLVDDGSGWYYLTGELVNTSSQWAHINSLAGAVKNDANDVLSADWTGTYVTLLAPTGDADGRDRTPFEIDFPNPGGGSKWALYPDTSVANNVTEYPMGVEVTNSYFDQYGSANLVGWITNGSDQALNTLVVAGLYAADNTVLDSSYSFVPITVKPGAAVPFSISSFGNVDYNQAQAALVDTYSVQPDLWFTSPPFNEFIDLSTSGDTVQKDGATWTMTGSVSNTSGKILSSITVVAMVMDGDKLIAMDYSTIYPTGDTIAVGETNTYEIYIYLDSAADATSFTTTTMVVGNVK